MDEQPALKLSGHSVDPVVSACTDRPLRRLTFRYDPTCRMYHRGIIVDPETGEDTDKHIVLSHTMMRLSEGVR